MVPLYILGLLKRYGPQHGYQIKKTVAESLSDFTQIKLPTIYYHLAKMAADGLLSASSEKPGARPEKTVYTMTEKGEAAYRGMIKRLLEEEYRPAFSNDGIFYFSDHCRPAEIVEYLRTYTGDLKEKLGVIDRHLEETMRHVPDEAKIMVGILFSHHVRHYIAELDWAEEALRDLTQ
jgi:DNA-binding PadR family transcriptional regulator